MAYRRITLPEPPVNLPTVPDIFDRGIATVVKRAVIIGNGHPGAENQCLGLVRALGLGSSVTLHRVSRPSGGLNEWLKWLPLSIHQTLTSAINKCQDRLSHWKLWMILNQILNTQPFRHRYLPWKSQTNANSPPYSSSPSSSSSMSPSSSSSFQNLIHSSNDLTPLTADPKQIAEMAKQEMDRQGPLLVIASGADTVTTSIAIKKLSPECTFVIQIQHPRCDVKKFDMVITPLHDYYGLTANAKKEMHPSILPWISPPPPEKNVVLTLGALHHCDSATLRLAAIQWHNPLASLPKPLISVCVGGPTRHCKYGDELIKILIMSLKQVISLNGGFVRMTFSRRTPLYIQNHIQNELGLHDRVYIWDGKGLNPHLGHLAWSDVFIISADSISMISEACSTGKPVYIIGEEFCTWKFKDFHSSLKKRGAVKPFTGSENFNDSWSYPPLRDTMEVADKVKVSLAERGWNV